MAVKIEEQEYQYIYSQLRDCKVRQDRIWQTLNAVQKDIHDHIVESENKFRLLGDVVGRMSSRPDGTFRPILLDQHGSSPAAARKHSDQVVYKEAKGAPAVTFKREHPGETIRSGQMMGNRQPVRQTKATSGPDPGSKAFSSAPGRYRTRQSVVQHWSQPLKSDSKCRPVTVDRCTEEDASRTAQSRSNDGGVHRKISDSWSFRSKQKSTSRLVRQENGWVREGSGV